MKYDGDTQRQYSVHIFVPTASAILRLDRDNKGVMFLDDLNGTWYYQQTDCQGIPYVSAPSQDLWVDGILHYITSSKIFWSIPSFTNESRTFASYKNMAGGPCYNSISTRESTPVQQYTENDIGFSLPLSFPLHFEVTQ